MKEQEKQIILNEQAINELNEFLSDLGLLKSTYNLFTYCLEEEIYVESKSEIYCFANSRQ